MSARRHGGRALSPVAALLIAALLAACSTDAPKVELQNIPPKDFKDQILREIPNVLGDPTNIRGAFYSDPAITPDASGGHYTSCVRFNSRDPANKQYMGSRDYIAHYFGGELNQFMQATAEQCGKAAYKPFPELEKLCLGQRCL